MDKMLVIGPVPPPIHGESLAVHSVVKSDLLNRNYHISLINTNKLNVTNAGKFSIGKVLKDIKILQQVFANVFMRKKDICYISISQTRLGLLRDLVIILLCSLRSKKIIAHLHGNNLGNVIDKMSRCERTLVKNIFKKIDSGIVLGNGLKNNFKGFTKSIKVVANGVDGNYITDEELNSKEKDTEFIDIVYLSNLLESKGYQYLIEAVASLIEEGENVRLTLAGAIFNQEKFDMIWNTVKDRRLEERIKHLGVVDGIKKKQLLLSSDIMVLPTNYPIEGQPVSIIEGMAAGLPIIATKRGSIPDLITNNGILIETGSTHLVKKTLSSLINNPKELKNMSKNSRENFLNNFTLEKNIKKIQVVISDSEGEIRRIEKSINSN
ncbi:glycosyltransferase family 4 protein [Priestia megaterium]|uniref:glycosyltransferase family 4 protein n=1 Tax=Priestia megaterium TaxID=1404 RepID=UPI0006982010|nr:glycosyltransferase family 4 protein [Priestia megaterium]